MPNEITTAEYQAPSQDQARTSQPENQIVEMSSSRLASFTSAAEKVSTAIYMGMNVIDSVSCLKEAVGKLYASVEGTMDLADRHRSLEMVIVNATRHPLLWEEPYFDSGTTFSGPMPINIAPVDEVDPMGAALWTVANDKGSILTGVSGAGKWLIAGTRLAVNIGFTNPQYGGFKNEIGIVGRDAAPRLAYLACDNMHAKEYDLCGFDVNVYPDAGRLGGSRRFVFCITESQLGTQPNRGDLLQAGEYLKPGDFLQSRNGRYAAYYRPRRGQLAVYDLNGLRREIWSTGSSNRSAWRAGLSSDGAFTVSENEKQVVWSAPVNAPGGFIHLTDSGSLALLDHAKQQVWATQ